MIEEDLDEVQEMFRACRCPECRYLRARMIEEDLDEVQEMFRAGMITSYVYDNWSAIGLLETAICPI